MTKKVKLPKNRPLRIAIIGIDCSGKTTLADRLKRKFGEIGLSSDVINFPRIMTTSRKFNKFMDFLEQIEIYGHKKDDKTVTKLAWSAMTLLYPLKKITISKKKIALYDRDMLIEPLIYAEEYNAKVLSRVLPRLVSRPDIIIKLNCSPETARKRIVKRFEETPKYRKKIQKHEMKASTLSKLNKLYDNVLSKLKKKYNLPILYIDGESEFEDIDIEKSKRDVCKRAFEELIKIIQK